MPRKANKIEPRTIQFGEELDKMIASGNYIGNDAIAEVIGGAKKNTISEIKSKRQNVQPEQWEKFKTHFKIKDNFDSSEKSLLPIKARLIELEARSAVFEITIIDLLAVAKKKSSGLVASELKKAISNEREMLKKAQEEA